MTPQISFYIFPDDSPSQRSTFACRLAEKAWRNDVKTHIHLSGNEDMRRLNDLLWSYREDSFLPHAESGQPGSEQVPVTIGCSEEQLKDHQGLLINLGDTIPVNIRGFSRIAEIVVQDPDILELARQRFSQYRDQGLSPKHQRVGRPS